MARKLHNVVASSSHRSRQGESAGMETFATSHGITFTSDVVRIGADDRALRSAAARGELIRVHRGAFVPAEVWDGMDRNERYRCRVRAVGLVSRGRPVLSHESAAALWGIPTIRASELVHVLTSPTAGTRTENGVRRHGLAVDDEDVLEDGGFRFTSLRRTLLDLLRDGSFPAGTVALDWALRPARSEPKPSLDRQAFASYVAHQALGRGAARVARVLAFADPRAESPGESVSRAMIHELGFPSPDLQSVIRDERGFVGRVDFHWPEHRLIGEFDGEGKYGPDGATARRMVIDEKWREDRLRRTGRGMVRWGWRTASDGPQLFELLHRAGLPSARTGPVRRIRAT
ncbi:type IV toxin-antitoxin system AbiEi family antitoxin domain-containing protein [Naasia sp. SYSU D00057]|uniref:type IV toxin-antitoxin system AbiEi family antitoxin domain-containing protein n=1 Tax=Naasia sp. SYSU D00057 TaxID=2817380 RepID=UPI001B304475|nr:type IV toxin-antitoxin system AbiEi family antitoxin domain-containing protein [Naasia sp. SYSU D00057]